MDPEANAASVALIDRDKVLLIRRARPPFEGYWTLPGGRRQHGETAEECAIREVHEELGFAARGLVFVATSRFRVGGGARWTLAVFVTVDFEGTLTPSDEVADCRWVPRDEVGDLTVTDGLGQLLDAAFLLVGAT